MTDPFAAPRLPESEPVLEPLRLLVYDKTFRKKGEIGAPKFATVVERFNKKGMTTVGLLSNDRMIEHLVANGARMVIRDEADQHVMSGYVSSWRGAGPTTTGTFEVTVEDDFVELEDMLGWVIPTAPITAQGTAGVNWQMTGPAETVLKAAVTANATRLGKPLTCAPDQGRGATITARLRFHPLYDRLFPIVDGAGIDGAGIGVTVRQVGAGLVLDVFEPNQYPRDLTEDSGAILEYAFGHSTMTASRVAVGGQGEAQLRMLRTVVDSARETQYGRIRERWRDARDTDDPTVLYARGQETLDEGAPKSGLSLTLAQTPSFRYGTNVRVGDRVKIRVGPESVPPFEDVLTEATRSWTAGEGWAVTPKVGERSEDPDTILSGALRTLARRVANAQRT